MGFVLLLLSATEGWSGSYQKGLDAYNREAYSIALNEWESLAKQGDVSAQYNLGYMYDVGLGVHQNYRTTIQWYTRAAKKGNSPVRRQVGATSTALSEESKQT